PIPAHHVHRASVRQLHWCLAPHRVRTSVRPGNETLRAARGGRPNPDSRDSTEVSSCPPVVPRTTGHVRRLATPRPPRAAAEVLMWERLVSDAGRWCRRGGGARDD